MRPFVYGRVVTCVCVRVGDGVDTVVTQLEILRVHDFPSALRVYPVRHAQ